MGNKTSYTNGQVTLGGTLSFEQMAKVEEIFKTAALDAATAGNTRDLEMVTELAEIIGVDSATLEDASEGLHEVA
jgi:hypothetical protein